MYSITANTSAFHVENKSSIPFTCSNRKIRHLFVKITSPKSNFLCVGVLFFYPKYNMRSVIQLEDTVAPWCWFEPSRSSTCERGGKADVQDLESCVRKGVWVQIPPFAPLYFYILNQ